MPKLASDIPHDILEKFLLGYSVLGAGGQRPFDIFSWQSFVALNWPADLHGHPLKDSILTHAAAPRVWEFYKTADEVFEPGKYRSTPGRRVFRVTPAHNSFVQVGPVPIDPNTFQPVEGAAFPPLIDRNLNFVMYDIVMNDVEYQYIKSNGLDTRAGQRKFKDMGQKVSFPLGFYQDPIKQTGGSVGAIEIKTSWRLLDPRKDDFKKFYIVPGDIFIDGEFSVTGKPLHIQSMMGLVGMHIAQRTTGPYRAAGTFPQNWIWSTFEHVDNAPLAANARHADDTKLPLPKSGTAPDAVSRIYSFFNPDYKGPTNELPKLVGTEKTFRWNNKPPYAARYANGGKYGTQVVRDWRIFEETNDLNEYYRDLLSGDLTNWYFRNLLSGTVWANYELVGTQWMADAEVAGQNGNIPRYLSNTTMETAMQFNSTQDTTQTMTQSFFEGSCLNCHQYAKMAITTSFDLDANFSYLLQRAK